jgi:LysR family nitrogen assimilation transcriptional regulator
MEFRDLRAFATVVDLGGVSRASARLNVVQSAVSQAVQRLERELGVSLLIRRPGSGGVHPTEAGLALARHAEVILNAMGRARAEMAEFSGLMRGTVNLGILPTATPLVLAALIKAARLNYPGLQIKAIEAPGPTLLEHLKLGRIDLAIAITPADVEGMVTNVLYETELVVISALDRDLAPTIELSEVATEAWVSFPLHHPGREWLEKAFSRLGRRPRVEIQVESLTQLKTSVEAGLGLALVPIGATVVDVKAGLLRMTRLSYHPTCELAYIGDLSKPSPAVLAVKSLLDAMALSGEPALNS